MTCQALESFKRQQEQDLQEQSALAAEARETRRQELLEKIAEGQAAKKQKLDQESGSGGSREAGGSQAAAENEAGGSQASGEPEEAGEGGACVLAPGEGRGRSFGNPGWESRAWDSLGDGKTLSLNSPNSLGFISPGSSSPQPGPSNGAAPLPRSALLVQLATARPRPIKARPLDWRVQSKDWPHAGRPAHELRYSIYRDLWERGFFLSAAGKFGGDFLVYPGEFGWGPPQSACFLFVFSQRLKPVEGQETLGPKLV